MLSLPSEAAAALAARAVELRWLVWLIVKDRSTGDPESAGWWTGLEERAIAVKSAATGSNVVRTYNAAGALLGVSGLTRTGTLDPQQVTVSLSQIDESVAEAIRLYEPARAPVEIHLALCEPGTSTPLATPEAAFFGNVDEVRITTPEAGGFGSAELICVSHTRELTRASADSRSHESQKTRSATDTLYKYASVRRSVDFGGPVDPGPIGKPNPKKRKGS